MLVKLDDAIIVNWTLYSTNADIYVSFQFAILIGIVFTAEVGGGITAHVMRDKVIWIYSV